MDPLMYDVLVVGGGAAGLSAALVLGRARRSVLLLDDGKPRNAPADTSHGFVTQDGTSPAKLLRDARAQLVPYTTESLANDSVRRIAKRKFGFALTATSGATFHGRGLLLTTGVLDVLPQIRDIEKHWGKSVFVYPFCDGWEVRDQRIAYVRQESRGRGTGARARRLERRSCRRRRARRPYGRDRRWLTAAGVGLHLGRPLALEGAGRFTRRHHPSRR